MDLELVDLTQALQERLDSFDAQRDRHNLIWAHEYLPSMMHRIDTRIGPVGAMKSSAE